MPQYLVVHDGGWAEIETAETPEQARQKFIKECRAMCDRTDDCFDAKEGNTEREAFDAGIGTITVKDLSKERSEYCVCGVHESEHLLCGCGEWERAG